MRSKCPNSSAQVRYLPIVRVEPHLRALEQRIAALEAESEIRTVVARYMEICDDLHSEAPFAELGELFARDAVWEGKGRDYDQAFGGHHGREGIVAFLRTYADPPHFSSNAHFLTSESLAVSGATATGSWVMLQTPSFANGENFVLAARLHLQFKLEDERWRIARFATTNLFGRPIKGAWQSNVPSPVPQTDNSKRSD